MSQLSKNGMQHLAIQRCIHTPNLEFLPQRLYKLCIRLDANSRGQGHSDWKMERDTPPFQDAFTHQIGISTSNNKNISSRYNYFKIRSNVKFKVTSPVHGTGHSTTSRCIHTPNVEFQSQMIFKRYVLDTIIYKLGQR